MYFKTVTLAKGSTSKQRNDTIDTSVINMVNT